MRKILVAIVLLLMLAGSLYAGDQKNGVQLSWGLFSFGLNYERLLGGMHGVLVEGVYSPSEKGGGSLGGGAGYRWHWSREKGLGSGFLGLMVKYFSMSGEVTITSGNTVTKSPVTATLFSIVPHIGKRWIIGPGVSIVARVGYGYANTNFNWSDIDAVDNFIEDAFELVGAFDGELSIGYSF
jgi:hypothetical protein